MRARALPTNLARDQPVDGLSPQTQAELVAGSLDVGMPLGELRELLFSREGDRASH